MLNRRSFMVAVNAAIAFMFSANMGRATGKDTNPDRSAEQTADATAAVVAAAENFLKSLSPAQRNRVLYAVNDPAMRQWIYFPSRRDRNGIAFEDLNDAQRAAAFGVAQAMLSESGYEQFHGILTAEDELGVRNNETHVNSGRYFIALFGSPDMSRRFTVQINGHHLAINTTYENGQVSPTPSFIGVDPVEIDMDGRRVRPMQVKTDAFSGLLNSLSEGELAAARIGPIDDVRVGTGASSRYPQPEGLLVNTLHSEQQEWVKTVVRAWVGDTNTQVADLLMQQYQSEFDRTRIAWSGSKDPTVRGAYLRVDGPRLWIEFSNVGRFGNGDNHYHSAFRDKQTDYLA